MTVYAFILINSEVGYEKKLIPELKMIDKVSEVFLVLGLYDIIVKVKANSIQEIETVVAKIRQFKSIKSTLSMMTTPPQDNNRESGLNSCD